MPLTPSNVPTKFRLNNQNTYREKCQNVISEPQNGHHSPRSRSFEVKYIGKVRLTPSNVSSKFHWNNQHTFGEKCKNVISDPKTGCHFLRSRSFEVIFADKVPFILYSNVPTKFRLYNQNRFGEKCNKSYFRP